MIRREEERKGRRREGRKGERKGGKKEGREGEREKIKKEGKEGGRKGKRKEGREDKCILPVHFSAEPRSEHQKAEIDHQASS